MSKIDSQSAIERKPVKAIELEGTENVPESHSANEWRNLIVGGLWIDAVAIAIAAAGLFASREFWQSWLTTNDKQLFVLFGGFGLFVELARARFWEKTGRLRFGFGVAVGVVAAALAILGFLPGFAVAGVFGMGLALTCWFVLRVSGRPVSLAVCLGIVVMLPTIIGYAERRGWFGRLEPIAVQTTSDIADFLVLPHVVEGKSILFGYGTAEYFQVVGNWDGLISLMGLSVLITLMFRRRLVCATLTMASTVLIWIATRTVGWTALVLYSMNTGGWNDWTSTVGAVVFAIGALLLLCFDLCFAAIFSPIPYEYVSTDFPLFVIVWNWLCSLPERIQHVPIRDSVFVPFDTEDGRAG